MNKFNAILYSKTHATEATICLYKHPLASIVPPPSSFLLLPSIAFVLLSKLLLLHTLFSFGLKTIIDCYSLSGKLKASSVLSCSSILVFALCFILQSLPQESFTFWFSINHGFMIIETYLTLNHEYQEYGSWDFALKFTSMEQMFGIKNHTMTLLFRMLPCLFGDSRPFNIFFHCYDEA